MEQPQTNNKPFFEILLCHFVPESIQWNDYVNTLIDFYNSITQWFTNYVQTQQQQQSDNCHKAAKLLQSDLSEFLSLPLRSDEEQIQEIIAGQFQQFSNEILSPEELSVSGYKYIHPINIDTHLKQCYNRDELKLKKALPPKIQSHTAIDTWFRVSRLETFFLLQQNIYNVLNEQFARIFSSLLYPSASIFFEIPSSNYTQRNKFRLKITITVNERFGSFVPKFYEAIEKSVFNNFTMTFLRPNALPSTARDEIFLFDVSDREELNRLRVSLSDCISSLHKMKIPVYRFISIRETEKIEESTL
ncbi:MAG TPA: hypothetical protein PK595_00560 [Bacteroidota bacterium]|nr:hypothetical protein [Bacteroidota bacterium]